MAYSHRAHCTEANCGQCSKTAQRSRTTNNKQRAAVMHGLAASLQRYAVMTSSSSGGHLKAGAPVWEIGYLPTDFRIASLYIEQLWRSWHVVVFTGNISTTQTCSKSASCAAAGHTGKDHCRLFVHVLQSKHASGCSM